MSAHRLQIKARFSELDPYNHVNHAVYVSWFEAGRTEALDAVGLGLHVLAEQGWQVVVAELNVRFRAPAAAGDTVVVVTELAELGAVVGLWRQRMHLVGPDGGDGRLVCEATVRAGAVGADGRPRRLPPEVVEQLRALMPEPSVD